MSDIIWSSKLDSKFDVTVTRKDRHNAIFQVSLEGEILYEADVFLSYGAVFGPDVSDIQKWCDMGIDFIDNKYTENK